MIDTAPTLAQLADDMGISTVAVRNRIHRGTLDVKIKHECEKDYRDHVQDMSQCEAVEYLLNCIDVLTRPCTATPAVDGLTFREARIFHALANAPGKQLSHSRLMDAVYFDEPGEAPSQEVLRVFINRMRNKGAPIETIWGFGYKLEADQ